MLTVPRCTCASWPSVTSRAATSTCRAGQPEHPRDRRGLRRKPMDITAIVLDRDRTTI